MIGIEGLALLRSAVDRDDDFVAARVAELKKLVDSIPGDESAGERLTELGLSNGYAFAAHAYDADPHFLIAAEEPAVRRVLAGLPPGRALDAACGTGRHSANLVSLGHDVIGIDQSPKMLELAAAKVPEATFEVGDLEGLPLPDGAVDLVVCGLALSHLPDITDVIGEFRRVLRPGGHLIVSDLHPVMVLLHGQYVWVGRSGELLFMRNHPRLISDYLTAFAIHGFTLRSCQEPLFAGPLPPGGYEEQIADAANAAWDGVPSAIVWEVRAP
ncbi:class I SAM-dependent methyltransferase [Actinokineospora iranica]|nr:class I SAM-dependent methyltransferase [Actinokineospora iranica]